MFQDRRTARRARRRERKRAQELIVEEKEDQALLLAREEAEGKMTELQKRKQRGKKVKLTKKEKKRVLRRVHHACKKQFKDENQRARDVDAAEVRQRAPLPAIPRHESDDFRLTTPPCVRTVIFFFVKTF